MSADRKSLHSLRVVSPCPKTWEALEGDETERFCGQCQKSVHNLSALTAKEAEELLAKTGGHLCVRYDQGRGGRPVYADDFRLNRLLALVAGFVLVAVSPASQWPSWAEKARTLLDKEALVQKGKGIRVPVPKLSPIRGRPATPPVVGDIAPVIIPPTLGRIASPSKKPKG